MSLQVISGADYGRYNARTLALRSGNTRIIEETAGVSADEREGRPWSGVRANTCRSLNVCLQSRRQDRLSSLVSALHNFNRPLAFPLRSLSPFAPSPNGKRPLCPRRSLHCLTERHKARPTATRDDSLAKERLGMAMSLQLRAGPMVCLPTDASGTEYVSYNGYANSSSDSGSRRGRGRGQAQGERQNGNGACSSLYDPSPWLGR